MEIEGLIKIYCANCDSIFSVMRHPTVIDPNDESEWLGIGYHGRFGVGEEGVWFCPFCGEGERTALREVEEEEDSPYDYDEEDIQGK
jgi:hypothetical protein